MMKNKFKIKSKKFIIRFVEEYLKFFQTFIKNESQFKFLFEIKKGTFSPKSQIQKLVLPNYFAL